MSLNQDAKPTIATAVYKKMTGSLSTIAIPISLLTITAGNITISVNMHNLYTVQELSKIIQKDLEDNFPLP